MCTCATAVWGVEFLKYLTFVLVAEGATGKRVYFFSKSYKI